MAMTKPTSEQVTFLQTGTGATTRTVDAKLKDTVSVKDFGAVGDGVTDDTAAINASLTASNVIYFPTGIYLTSGNHNIKNKTLNGVSQELSIIKLSGTNTNTSLFINGNDITTPWGNGAGCILQNLGMQGNWDGATENTVTNISNIGSLLKWWSGAYVRVNDCNFKNSFGFGIFSYQLGYSYFNGCFVSTNGKNGIHLTAPSGSDAITTTSIINCSINSCRGRVTDAITGGNGIYIKNGFSVSVITTVVEDLNDGLRLDGSDNRSISLFYLHSEQCTNYDVYYVGSGLDLGMYQCVFASTNKIFQSNPSFTKYTAINNFGIGDIYELPTFVSAATQVQINAATPKTTMASLTLTPGTWNITGAWNGSLQGGLGQASADQAYAINTSASIPAYSSSFNAAVFLGDRTSAVNSFSPLQGSLSLIVTVTVDTVYYLYGGTGSITASLVLVLAGHLKAVKINGPYI